MKIDFKELVKMVEEVSSKDYQKSDRIKTHASRRMSTKGKTNKIGKPYSQDPPTARAKSAPPGFGFTMEELYELIDQVLLEQPEEEVPATRQAAEKEASGPVSAPQPTVASADVTVENEIRAKLIALGVDPQGDDMKKFTIGGDAKLRKVMVPAHLRSEPPMLDALEKALLNHFPSPQYTLEQDGPVMRKGNPIGWTIKEQGSGRPKIAARYVFKPSGRSTLNQGDVAEGILGAGLYVKFLNPDVKVTDAMIHKVLEKAKAAATSGGKNTRSEIRMKSKRKGGADAVSLVISLANANFEALVDPKWHKELAQKYSSVLAYVNGEDVLSRAEGEAVDKETSKIEIISDGTSDQSGTKIDVKVLIDGVETPLGRISLKAGSKQMGQVGSGRWGLISGEEGFFARVLTVQPRPELEEPWTEAWGNKDGPELSKLGMKLYETIAEDVTVLRGSDENAEAAWFQKMIQGIQYAATLGEEGVVIVDFSSGNYKVLNFDILPTVLDGMDIDLEVQFRPSGKSPYIYVHDKVSGEDLISMRMRFEGDPKGKVKNVRHYVQKESLLSKIINVTSVVAKK